MLFTSDGDVWLWGNRNGCCRIRYINGSFQTWRPDEKMPDSRSVSFVFKDSGQCIWIGADSELFTVTDGTAQKVYSYNIHETVSQKVYFYNAHEADGRLFFVATDRIVVFDNIQQTFLPAVGFESEETRSLNVQFDTEEQAKHLNFNSEQTLSVNGAALVDNIILIAARTDMYAFDTKSLTMTVCPRP